MATIRLETRFYCQHGPERQGHARRSCSLEVIPAERLEATLAAYRATEATCRCGAPMCVAFMWWEA